MQGFESSFDATAENYHNARPGYPQAMYDDLTRICSLSESSRVLEIGAGSGIATKQLAEYGCEIVAAEPGEHLIAIARRQLSRFPRVRLLETTFEDYVSGKPFDMIFSATAFHWLDQAAKYEKCDALLNGDGHLVLVWNNFCSEDSETAEEISSVFAEHFPAEEANLSPNARTLSKLAAWEKEIYDSQRFFIRSLNRYLTRYDLDSGKYLALLNTHSEIINAAEPIRESFLRRIAEIVNRYHGVVVPVLTSLYVCKKTSRISGL